MVLPSVHRPSAGFAAVSQSRRMSAVESIANVAVGYGVAIVTQVAVFPLFGIAASLGDNLAIGGIFAAISIVRSYVLRRVFNGRWR